MQQDNIKHFEYAAYRLYGHTDDISTLSDEDARIFTAAASALRHLKIDNKHNEVKAIKYILCDLPLGNIPTGTITARAVYAAEKIVFVEVGVIWRYMKHARTLFNEYYKEYTSQKG